MAPKSMKAHITKAAGFLAAALGWQAFYTVCLFAAVPAMLVMLRILRRFPPEERQPAS